VNALKVSVVLINGPDRRNGAQAEPWSAGLAVRDTAQAIQLSSEAIGDAIDVSSKETCLIQDIYRSRSRRLAGLLINSGLYGR
jgi:hypothetical protein